MAVSAVTHRFPGSLDHTVRFTLLCRNAWLFFTSSQTSSDDMAAAVIDAGLKWEMRMAARGRVAELAYICAPFTSAASSTLLS